MKWMRIFYGHMRWKNGHEMICKGEIQNDVKMIKLKWQCTEQIMANRMNGNVSWSDEFKMKRLVNKKDMQCVIVCDET